MYIIVIISQQVVSFFYSSVTDIFGFSYTDTLHIDIFSL